MSAKPPLALAISPAKSLNALSHPVTVVNLGSKPVTVAMSIGEVVRQHGACAVDEDVHPSWVTVSPARFTIAPGHSVATHVTATGPSPAAGANLAVTASTVPGSAAGMVKTRASLVAQVAVSGSHGKMPACLSLPRTAPGHAAAPAGEALWAAPVLAVAALAAAIAARRRGRRRPGAHARRRPAWR